jgi:hypothetical protein
MQIKRWESPRRKGRNDKGKGGSARLRQLKKQRQMLRRKLKEINERGERCLSSPLFFKANINAYSDSQKSLTFISER